MAKVVYLVMHGAYSDMSPLAVFATREAADRAVRCGYGDDVEEVYLEPQIPDPPPGLKFFIVINAEGRKFASGLSIPHTIEGCSECSPWPVQNDGDGNFTLSEDRVINKAHDQQASKVCCWAKDHVEAIEKAKAMLSNCQYPVLG